MPLSFDMPFEKLQQYAGRNPRPADFDAFWERGVAELDGVEADVGVKTAVFQSPIADCYHLYFTGVGGARIHAKLLHPKQSKQPHPAVLMFHGYHGDSGSWARKLAYVAEGYTVAALDCRGQGGLSEDAGGVRGNTLSGHIIRGLAEEPEKLLFRQIYLDVAQLARLVMGMPEVDETRVGAMGASQGGALTLICAALEPRLKLAAPTYPFLCDFQRIWEMDSGGSAYAELSDYFRRFDPRHQHEAEMFMKLGYIDVQHFAPRIKAEVMMTTCLMDTLCPPSTQFAAYNKIESPKSLQVYPDFGHETPAEFEDLMVSFMQKLSGE